MAAMFYLLPWKGKGDEGEEGDPLKAMGGEQVRGEGGMEGRGEVEGGRGRGGGGGAWLRDGRGEG